MAFKIEELRKLPDGAMYVSPERICVSADGELCDETDPHAVRLLVAKGGEIPAAEAAKYGLIARTEQPTPQPEEAPAVSAAPAEETASAEETGEESEKKPRGRR